MSARNPVTPDLANLARGIRAGERAVIARAITLVESRRSDHQKAARRLVQDLLPATGKAVRVGVTGVPGRNCAEVVRRDRRWRGRALRG